MHLEVLIITQAAATNSYNKNTLRCSSSSTFLFSEDRLDLGERKRQSFFEGFAYK